MYNWQAPARLETAGMTSSSTAKLEGCRKITKGMINKRLKIKQVSMYDQAMER